MPADLRLLAGVDRLIHEPSRSSILAILASVESADFLYLQRETGLTKGNLSVHLTKLEEAGYVSIQKTYHGKIGVEKSDENGTTFRIAIPIATG